MKKVKLTAEHKKKIKSAVEWSEYLDERLNDELSDIIYNIDKRLLNDPDEHCKAMEYARQVYFHYDFNAIRVIGMIKRHITSLRKGTLPFGNSDSTIDDYDTDNVSECEQASIVRGQIIFLENIVSELKKEY